MFWRSRHPVKSKVMSGQIHSVSIVIPAYNSAEWVEATIESCLNQTVGEVEIVVVDDGSTDATLDAVSRFGRRVTSHSLANGGVSRARNFGALKTSGEWLLFLDSDDRLLPHAVESLQRAAESRKASVAYGMVIERREPPAIPRLNGFDFCAGAPPLPSQANINRGAIITPGSAIVRRDVFENAGGFISGTEPMEDRDLWMRCGLLASIAHCDTVVLDKTWRPGSHGTQDAKRIYRGWLAKRRLRAWGAERGLEIDWIPNDAGLLTSAIQEAFHWRCWGLLEPLLADARRLGLSNGWTARGHAARIFFSLTGRGQPRPDWIDVSAGLLSNGA